MQIANVKKIFQTFQTIKHEKYILNNKAKISENSNQFFRSLVKSLEIKFLHTVSRSSPWECYYSKWENSKG